MMCWAGLHQSKSAIRVCLSQIPHSMMSNWELEIGHDETISTLETVKCYKLGFFHLESQWLTTPDNDCDPYSDHRENKTHTQHQ